MTSKLKCPFCGQELIREGMNHWWCSCNIEHQGKELYGTTALWQALIQAKQDLEIARKALEDITKERCVFADWFFKAVTMTSIAEKALEQIEHKE